MGGLCGKGLGFNESSPVGEGRLPFSLVGINKFCKSDLEVFVFGKPALCLSSTELFFYRARRVHFLHLRFLVESPTCCI